LEEAHPRIPNSTNSLIKQMLKEIGVESVVELFKDIPEEVKFGGEMKVGKGKPRSEIEIREEVESLLRKNKGVGDILILLGAGCWPHYVPSVTKYIVRRGKLYTSYTPYQPEASQGLCQALFEYQGMIVALTGMDVVNTSLYDGSTALAEAILMAVRVTKRKEILVPCTMNPEYKEVIRTLTSPKGVKVREVAYDKERGFMDLESLKAALSNKVAAVYFENPSYLGFI